ncbi:hypothetical protein QJS10_CPB20g00146 [Acorus calamus]|uniref:Uncharacterized protein n=1 Tax=Acorus calamus TaxID=4465 RepID=A0AAV9C8U9_ACOCL|nr:hypothetical protein QJS10_CPB20g00146 [Acorus calamus]
MCILCVVQRWSRRAATMLPWLVIPLIGLWLLSQLLPPTFRFEVTSPRLACALVLLATLFWYEVLMPRLSSWQARQAYRHHEQSRTEKAELEKLRKTATRRCRNCLTPYRDQNPGGGRFTCFSCGHVSKRPVLDLPGPGPGRGLCLGGNSVNFGRRVLAGSFVGLRWVRGKVFGVGAVEVDLGSEDQKGVLKKGESESRWEKAKRKAEEKRQAKLEKIMLEEEERKQREEVARLVEERRKLRDEISEAEKGVGGRKTLDLDRENRKREVLGKRRQERKKGKDKGSSKSSSDGEEMGKRVGSRESEKKREFDRRAVLESVKAQVLESMKGGGGFNRGSAGRRYFDSLKGLGGAGIFGKSVQAAQPNASAAKLNRPSGFSDHGLNSFKRTTIGKSENIKQPLGSDAQPKPTVLKKSWQQLFTRSSLISPSAEGNAVNQMSVNSKSEALRVHSPVQVPPTYTLSNEIQYGLPNPLYSSPLTNVSLGNNSIPYLEHGHMSSPVRGPPQNVKLEEAELFEDPCYVPDPMSLLGPVSKSLDNFIVDSGTVFVEKSGSNTPCMLKNVALIADASRPSPIESPMSRSRVSDEKHSNCIQRPHTPKEKDICPEESGELRTWQMWNSHPLQDGLGIVGRPGNWLLPIGPNKVNQEDIGKGAVMQFMTDNKALPGACSSPISSIGMLQNGGAFSPISPRVDDMDASQEKTIIHPLLDDGQNYFPPLNLGDNTSRNKVNYESPGRLAAGNPVGPSSLIRHPEKDWALRGGEDGMLLRPSTGDAIPFSIADLESFWST